MDDQAERGNFQDSRHLITRQMLQHEAQSGIPPKINQTLSL